MKIVNYKLTICFIKSILVFFCVESTKQLRCEVKDKTTQVKVWQSLLIWRLGKYERKGKTTNGDKRQHHGELQAKWSSWVPLSLSLFCSPSLTFPLLQSSFWTPPPPSSVVAVSWIHNGDAIGGRNPSRYFPGNNMQGPWPQSYRMSVCDCEKHRERERAAVRRVAWQSGNGTVEYARAHDMTCSDLFTHPTMVSFIGVAQLWP